MKKDKLLISLVVLIILALLALFGWLGYRQMNALKFSKEPFEVIGQKYSELSLTTSGQTTLDTTYNTYGQKSWATTESNLKDGKNTPLIIVFDKKDLNESGIAKPTAKVIATQFFASYFIDVKKDFTVKDLKNTFWKVEKVENSFDNFVVAYYKNYRIIFESYDGKTIYKNSRVIVLGENTSYRFTTKDDVKDDTKPVAEPEKVYSRIDYNYVAKDEYAKYAGRYTGRVKTNDNPNAKDSYLVLNTDGTFEKRGVECEGFGLVNKGKYYFIEKPSIDGTVANIILINETNGYVYVGNMVLITEQDELRIYNVLAGKSQIDCVAEYLAKE